MLLDFDISVQPVLREPHDDDMFTCFTAKHMLVKQDEKGFSIPDYVSVREKLSEDFHFFPLASLNGKVVYSFAPDEEVKPPIDDHLCMIETRRFREITPESAALMMSCHHLWRWYEEHRYCGRCGAKTAPLPSIRALKCSGCGNEMFPVIAPAVIVAITSGSRILRVRSLLRPAHYGLVAGYVEVGETLEHAVVREVTEEVGLTIRNIRYLGDQPWGFSGSHMFAFHAEADDTQPIQLQKNELSEAVWFDRKELPEEPMNLSIAGQLVEIFRTEGHF